MCSSDLANRPKEVTIESLPVAVSFTVSKALVCEDYAGFKVLKQYSH